MILLEGPNLCGKTTVAMRLRERLGRFSYRHTTRPMVEPIKYRLWQLADAHPYMIVDRCHWSDWAFAGGAGFTDQVTAADIGLSPGEWRLLELAFMSRGAHVLCMMDTAEGIMGRWQDGVAQYHSRPSMRGLQTVLARYAALLGRQSDPYGSHIPGTAMSLPDTEEGEGDWLTEFCRFAQRRADQCAYMLPPSLGIGPMDAEFMVICDDLPAGPPLGVTAKDRAGSVPDVPFGREWDDLWAAMDRFQVRWWKGYYTTSAAFQHDPRQFGEYCSHVLRSVNTYICLGPRSRELVKSGLGNPMLWGHQTYALVDGERDEGIPNICEHALTEWRNGPERGRVARLWTSDNGAP